MRIRNLYPGSEFFPIPDPTKREEVKLLLESNIKCLKFDTFFAFNNFFPQNFMLVTSVADPDPPGSEIFA